MTAEELLIYGLVTTFWVTVLTLLVLALREPVTRRFGSRAAMLLWTLPALRLIAPAFKREVLVPAPAAEPAAPLSILPMTAPAEASPATAAFEAVAASTPAPEAETAFAPGQLPRPAADVVSTTEPLFSMPSAEMMAAFVLSLWFLGVVVAVSLCWARAARWRATLLAEATSVPDHVERMAEDAAARVGTDKPFTLVMSGAAETPQIMGLRRPLLALPVDFTERYRRDEQEMALLHELTHLNRGDLSTMMVSELSFAVQWFNPITRYARTALRADQEAACDEAVRALGVNTKDYAALLLKAARIGRTVPALTLDHSLKERIIRMQNPLGTPLKRTFFALTAGASALALAGFTASRTEVAVYDHPDHEDAQSADDELSTLLEGLAPELRAAIEAEQRGAAPEAKAKDKQEEKAARREEAREAARAQARVIINGEEQADVADAIAEAIEALLAQKGELRDVEKDIRSALDDVRRDARSAERSEAESALSEALRELREQRGEHDADIRVLRMERRELLRDQVRERFPREARERREEHVIIGPDGHENRFSFSFDFDHDEDGASTEQSSELGKLFLQRRDRDGQNVLVVPGHGGDEVEVIIGGADRDLRMMDEGNGVFAWLEGQGNGPLRQFFAKPGTPRAAERIRFDHDELHESMVLLNDPFAEIGMPDIMPPEPPQVDIEPPVIKRKVTDEGTWLLIPEEPDMSAFEDMMEVFEEQMELFGERMEEWGERMGEAGEALGELAEECEEHIEDSDRPIILSERIYGSDEPVRAVCASGGAERLKSDEIAAFLRKEGVSRREMAFFEESIDAL
ncbi:MAG: M56 family metallopeptidase [Pseudomonadota bacterium]